jgi:spore germination protein YaaH
MIKILLNKTKIFLLAAILIFCFSKGYAQDQNITFNEIWGYLMNGEERFLSSEYPLTDIGYFAAEINTFGKLVNVPNRAKLKDFKGRVHLVVAQVSNGALTHFSLDPKGSVRAQLINDIVKASESFDGLQIDFELVPVKDREYFYSFLSELKRKIGKKTLSVAIAARTKYISDAYEYDKISAIADRVIIMAYDEHWGGSQPGSIASIDWCKKVAQYASSIIPAQKLVMGMPFYGRAWASINPSRAYKFSAITKLIEDKAIDNISFNGDIPYFKYQETVDVTVYFENAQTIMQRAKIYRDMHILNIAFWRLGQEEITVWDNLILEMQILDNAIQAQPKKQLQVKPAAKTKSKAKPKAKK